jgi:hypothetical protein
MSYYLSNCRLECDVLCLFSYMIANVKRAWDHLGPVSAGNHEQLLFRFHTLGLSTTNRKGCNVSEAVSFTRYFMLMVLLHMVDARRVATIRNLVA